MKRVLLLALIVVALSETIAWADGHPRPQCPPGWGPCQDDFQDCCPANNY
ncbi:MAG: hypothetical protein WAN65_17645 [Candidatus Sulfotelmatobacter sp.]